MNGFRHNRNERCESAFGSFLLSNGICLAASATEWIGSAALFPKNGA
jgi:hypothetical protein